MDYVANDRKIDYAFYDAGPNIGALNRVILLDCDYFIVPAACDLFSIRALKTLGQTLKRWINDWRTIAELAPPDVRLLTGFPKFLGYIPQRFRVYRGDVAAGYAKYLPQIETHIETDIVAVLKEVDARLAPESVGTRELGEVKDFGTIAAASQSEGVPMKDVKKAGTQIQRDEAAEKLSRDREDYR